jgi:hypothetical protein
MYEELLAHVTLFQDLTPRERCWLGDACREREYLPDAVLSRRQRQMAQPVQGEQQGS